MPNTNFWTHSQEIGHLKQSLRTDFFKLPWFVTLQRKFAVYWNSTLWMGFLQLTDSKSNLIMCLTMIIKQIYFQFINEAIKLGYGGAAAALK